MYRFGSRLLKLGLPLGLALYNIKPVLNKQQTQDKQKDTNFFIPTRQQFQSNHIPKTDQKQKEQEQNIISIQPNKNDEIPQKNQQQTAQQARSKQQLKNNQAIVTTSTPQIVINFLRMHGITVKINQRATSNFITVKNKVGDTFVIQNQNFLLLSSYSFFQLSNFFSPPLQIKSYQAIKPLIKNLANDQFIIATFIPQQQQYIKAKLAKSQYDSFTPMQKLEIKNIQQQFRKIRYESGSSKNSYLLIRDPEVARQLKMNTNKIGDKYVFYKTTQNSGMQTSTLLQGVKYTIKTISLNTSVDKNLIQKGLYSHLNIININEDARNLIRDMHSRNGPSKILLIYSRQKRNQFVNQLKSIALKVGKIMRQEVVVVLTENQKLLTDHFQVVPDDFVTVRLIDTNKFQAPLLTLAGFNTAIKNFYSRKVMSGPFSVQNVCMFIKNSNNLQEYYEKKKIHQIPSIVSQNQEIKNNTVVLHWKKGCRGCQLTHDYLQQIKKIFTNLDQQKRFKYQIASPKQTKNVQFRRLNILNEYNEKNSKNHDATPKLILHTNGKKKDLQIGKILGKISKINISNQNKVHQQIIKQIINSIEENLEEKQQI